MRAVISVNRPFHSAMLANSLQRQAASVDIYTSAPRRFFSGLDDHVRIRFRLAPFTIMAKFGCPLPNWTVDVDRTTFDRGVAALMRPSDLFIGWATMCLFSARTAKKAGSFTVLDRACPYVDFQQALIQREAERTGAPFRPESKWLRDRQLEEYELADRILVPSNYTASSFPTRLQPKLVMAPLLGRCRAPAITRIERNEIFTVGVVGGNPLRKGYLYLLRAWKRLALPKAKLLLRTEAGFSGYPVLQDLLNGLTNVEFVNYVPDISDFYQRCDAFVLPSVDDGFGMALIEAMANGRPCIATTNCGATDLLKAGSDAVVVAPADEDALADALLRFYNSEDLRRAVGFAATSRAQEIAASGLYDRAIAHLASLVCHRPIGTVVAS